MSIILKLIPFKMYIIEKLRKNTFVTKILYSILHLINLSVNIRYTPKGYIDYKILRSDIMAVGVKLISDEEASPEVKQMFEQIKKTVGMVPPTIRAMANKPEYLKNYLEKMNLVMGPGKLDRKTKLLLALTISTLNNCEMCITQYTNMSKGAGVTDEEIIELLSVIDLVGGTNHFNNGMLIKP